MGQSPACGRMDQFGLAAAGADALVFRGGVYELLLHLFCRIIFHQKFSKHCLEKFDVMATLKGGGKSAQAEALRHGISKALLEVDPENRNSLKKPTQKIASITESSTI